MSDVIQPRLQSWEPEVLDGEPMRPGWLSPQPDPTSDMIDLREVVIAEPTPPLSPEISVVEGRGERVGSAQASWLTAILKRVVDRNVSIRKVLEEGRNLDVEDVLRLRALHKGVQLLPELAWNGVETTVGEHLVKIAHTQETLLSDRNRELKELRFRMRLQGIGLEDTLISYAATELIDPVVMERTASLDVLCYPDLEMPSEIVLKLGLARAYAEEIEHADQTHAFRNDPLWSMVRSAWEHEMAYAKAQVRRWAQNVIAEGRSS